MHIGHTEDDMDQENLALRHLGEGIQKENIGQFHEALNEYMVANVLDPNLEIAQVKIDRLKRKMGL
ncbi:hypothetical protein Desor_0862 [Desulfosporosinus orientis DSM 765]|uniref:Tetratricopeptide repeat protein n=1 Tax=Desulfosporosinus orientis (strain ATCC 19365 / DSM 765 / NCIMB 8382 / VKM B-1628 / Singapore I) TaxID=768706 RepID=G7WCK5_DESOD|nr:hypothetical protein [Desulfosporosinus orientis]AET66543.1 hypothetical protein Desor_0862 [Desulfosporosinus orientis DSM 765]